MNITTDFLEEVKAFCGLSLNDEATNATIKSLIKTADKTLQGSLGANYPTADDRAVYLIKTIVNDLYSNRETESSKVANSTRTLINDMCLQIKLEMRLTANAI